MKDKSTFLPFISRKLLDCTCICFESQFGLPTVIEDFMVFLSTKRGNYVILQVLSHFINHIAVRLFGFTWWAICVTFRLLYGWQAGPSKPLVLRLSELLSWPERSEKRQIVAFARSRAPDVQLAACHFTVTAIPRQNESLVAQLLYRWRYKINFCYLLQCLVGMLSLPNFLILVRNKRFAS